MNLLMFFAGAFVGGLCAIVLIAVLVTVMRRKDRRDAHGLLGIAVERDLTMMRVHDASFDSLFRLASLDVHERRHIQDLRIERTAAIQALLDAQKAATR